MRPSLPSPCGSCLQVRQLGPCLPTRDFVSNQSHQLDYGSATASTLAFPASKLSGLRIFSAHGRPNLSAAQCSKFGAGEIAADHEKELEEHSRVQDNFDGAKEFYEGDLPGGYIGDVMAGSQGLDGEDATMTTFGFPELSSETNGASDKSPSQLDDAEQPPSPSSKPRHSQGLFRTPTSGGVQSATHVHGLPSPAVAVRNLAEQARFAHLCTIMSRMHHRRRGYPFGSLVDFAMDDQGHPVFFISPLAIHTRNLLADPRCTLVIQMPGWGGLGNARVTIFGDVYPLEKEHQEWAQSVFSRKYNHGAGHQWGNFHFYRMHYISDIYFVGGFGTVAWVDLEEYMQAQPDAIAAHITELTLLDLNSRFSEMLRELLLSRSPVGIDSVSIISVDAKGLDLRLRTGNQSSVQRLSFESSFTVQTIDDAVTAIQWLLDVGLPDSFPSMAK